LIGLTYYDIVVYDEGSLYRLRCGGWWLVGLKVCGGLVDTVCSHREDRRCEVNIVIGVGVVRRLSAPTPQRSQADASDNGIEYQYRMVWRSAEGER
jgi:hypothetical protein